MTLDTKAVVEHLIAALRNGNPTPQQVLSGLQPLGGTDVGALERVLLRELAERNRTGLLSGEELATLRRTLSRWLLALSEHESDLTDELDTRTTPLEPALPGSPSRRQVELRRGSILRDRYVLEDRIASGGMSLVFRARDLKRIENAGEIAIKVLRDDLRASDLANARLRREFRQTQALQHPGVVRMFDFDCDLGAWFITMERLEGMSLERWLKRAKVQAPGPVECMRITAACADVLAFAHAQGTIHGDFKPGNVYLERDGTVRVLDFGAALDSSAGGTPGEGPIPPIATRAYASPEVLEGQAPDARDDVFSLACVVYEMLGGRHPFGRVPANEARDASIVPTPVPHLSSAQNAALDSGLAWERAQRPASVQALLQSLMKDRGRATTADALLPVPAPPPGRHPRLPWQWLGTLAAAVAAVAILIAPWPTPEVEDFEAGRGDVGVARNVAAPAVPNAIAPHRSEPTPLRDEITPAPAPPLQVPDAAGLNQLSPREDSPRVTPSKPVAVRDPGVRVSAEGTSIVVSEGAPAAVIVLTREGNLAASTQLNWRLSNGSALARADFDGPVSGRVRFLSRQTTRALYVPLVNDAEQEAEETFSVQLTSRSAVIAPAGNHVTVTIVDDDS